MWVPLNRLAYSLLTGGEDCRLLAILYWHPEDIVEEADTVDEFDGPDVDTVIAPACYELCAVHDPRRRVVIEDGPEPDGDLWPQELLSAAAQAYHEEWG